MFNIDKNGKNASIQSILKSNSTYFMLNNFFCLDEYYAGSGGTFQSSSWKWN